MTNRERLGESNGPSASSELFFAGAPNRILKFTLVFAALLTGPVWWTFGMAVVIGFALGSVISWINFRALVRAVEGTASRIVDQHSSERGRTVVLRFLLHYVLVAGVAYAIFKGSALAFRGFLFGICLPVAAMLTEAAYEGYAALKRGY